MIPQPTHLLHFWQEPPLVSDREFARVLLGNVHDSIGRLERMGKGLFAEHVFAALQSGNDKLFVRRWWCGDRHDGDISAGQQFFRIAVREGDEEIRGGLPQFEFIDVGHSEKSRTVNQRTQCSSMPPQD